MRHRRRVKHFSRKSGPRKALLRGLVVSMVEHGRIKTTVDKAKEARRHVEKLVTLGKNDNLATRRLLLSKIPHENVVSLILSDISPRFKTRPGGYTQIIKIGRRPGDTAEMAFLQFVDYDYKTAAKSTEKEDKKSVKTVKSPKVAKAPKVPKTAVLAKKAKATKAEAAAKK